MYEGAECEVCADYAGMDKHCANCGTEITLWQAGQSGMCDECNDEQMMAYNDGIDFDEPF